MDNTKPKVKTTTVLAAKRMIKSALYSSAGMPLVKQIFSHWQGSFAIFCLHRVLPEKQKLVDASPNSNLVLSTKRFSEILQFLSHNYRMVSLDELVLHLQNHLSTS